MLWREVTGVHLVKTRHNIWENLWLPSSNIFFAEMQFVSVISQLSLKFALELWQAPSRVLWNSKEVYSHVLDENSWTN